MTEETPPVDQQFLTVDQILVKLILDSQTNINRLVTSQEKLGHLQEQQMIYINMIINKISHADSGLERGTERTTEVKPINSEPVTTEDKAV